jgi:hypothetical protein
LIKGISLFACWQQGEKANAHLNTFGFLPTQEAKTKKPKEFKF